MDWDTDCRYLNRNAVTAAHQIDCFLNIRSKIMLIGCTQLANWKIIMIEGNIKKEKPHFHAPIQ